MGKSRRKGKASGGKKDSGSVDNRPIVRAGSITTPLSGLDQSPPRSYSPNISQEVETNKVRKPIDTWLQLAGIVLGVVFFLVPKAPAVVVGCLICIFICFVHPVWNFWWVERSRFRRFSALTVLFLIVFSLGLWVWPNSGRGRELKVSFTIPNEEHPSRLRWQVDNPDSEPIQKFVHHFVSWNIDRPQLKGKWIQEPAKEVEFINGHNFAAGSVLPINSPVDQGDRVFTLAMMDCLGCIEKTYWIYFTQGVGGWYAEVPRRGTTIPNPTFAKEDPEAMIDNFAPHKLKKLRIGQWAVGSRPAQ